MVNEVTIGAALRSTLSSITRTQQTIDVITERLATGLEVNSAIDDPTNFFISRELRNTASDNSRLLDGIGQSIRTIQEGIIGLEAVERLIDQGEAIVQESLVALQAGNEDPAVFEQVVNASPPELDQQITSLAPDVYFRLNETGGPIIDAGLAGAGVNATYLGGASANGAPLYTNGSSPSVDFDGANDSILVDDSGLINLSTTPARTVELVFQADTVTGRQVLYEEGAGVNGLTIYLDDDVLYVTGEDDQGGQRWADADINSTQIPSGPVNIVAGQTYHVAFVYNSATDSFSGYLDGVLMSSVSTNGAPSFPSHSGNIGIGAAVDGVQFHDGEAGAGFNFDGRISNVAIHNNAISEADLLSHANSLEATTSLQYQNNDFNNVLSQLDLIVIDANYRGINLLQGEELRTDFNSERTSSLTTEGEDFSVDGLGILNFDFREEEALNLILDQLSDAKSRVREFAFTLSNDLSVIQVRDTFTRQSIVTLESGADDLTLADQNEEGAKLLASQTRLALGTTALSIASQTQSSIIGIIDN